MSINAITARRLTVHVTSYDARKMMYALGGPWPHRCKIGNGTENFQCTINEENSLYLDVAKGVAIFHGYVFSNDEIMSVEMARADSSSYKKATVYLKADILSYETLGIEQLTLEVAYSETASSAASISYPALETPAYDDYIIDDSPDPFYFPLAHVLIHGGAIEAVEDLLPLWDNKMFYVPGDEVDLYHNVGNGYLASNRTGLYFFINLAKPVSMVQGCTLSGIFTIRHADGGFIGSSSGQTLESLGTVTAELTENGIYVRVIMTQATELTNQSTISVIGNSGAKLTFF